MFNARSKENSAEAPMSGSSIIGPGTVITGDVATNGDIRIDGILKGNLIVKAKIFIGPDGQVEGNIEGKTADILGKVTGKIKIAELLYLRGKALVNGDIFTGKLQVDPTASFNGKCHMGANIVELNGERANAAVNQ